MKIEFKAGGTILVDGSRFGTYGSGCGSCGKKPFVKRHGVAHKFSLFNDENLQNIVTQILCKEQSMAVSCEFADGVIKRCEECFNEKVFVEI